VGSNPSILVPLLNSPSIANPVGWSSVNGKSQLGGSSYANSPAELSKSKDVSFPSAAAQSANKGPMVIRLASPGSDFEDSGPERSEDSEYRGSVSDDSSDG
jgi:hypothetical protein